MSTTTETRELNQWAPVASLEAPYPLKDLLSVFLSPEEQEQIHEQFTHACHPNSQVMWSGVARAEAQKWADERGLQTLTTAMGPLMDECNPLCLKSKKNQKRWSLYMKGASVLFAFHASRGSKVTVLLPPPPNTRNPCGLSNYQLVEEPVLQGLIGGPSVECINIVHPTVAGAENFSYQSWPIDMTAQWIEGFPNPVAPPPQWRLVKSNSKIRRIKTVLASAAARLFPGVPTVVDSLRTPETACKSAELQLVSSRKRILTKNGTIIPEVDSKTQGGVSVGSDLTKSERKRQNREIAARKQSEKAARKKANLQAAARMQQQKAEKKRKNIRLSEQAALEKAKRKQRTAEEAERLKVEKRKRKETNEQLAKEAKARKEAQKQMNKALAREAKARKEAKKQINEALAHEAKVKRDERKKKNEEAARRVKEDKEKRRTNLVERLKTGSKK